MNNRIKEYNRIYRLAAAVLFLVVMFSFCNTESALAEDVSTINNSMLTQINGLRASVGLPPLELDASLCQVAAIRAQEACTVWSHTRPNGTQGIDLLPRNKWRGENLSYVQYGTFTFTPGEQTAAANLMFANLKASPTHYDNMVFKSFTKIGIATFTAQMGTGVKFTTAYMFTN